MVLLVMVSWVIFRAPDLGHAAQFLSRMFGGGGPGWTEAIVVAQVPLDSWSLAVLVLGAVISFLPWSANYRGLEAAFMVWVRTPRIAPWFAAVVLLGLVLGCLEVVNSAYNPFIYFRF
jgi:alginate O-acetyltransferase complex protein AlgI